jgi:tRNA(fMet)-specific endonuclease VapC
MIAPVIYMLDTNMVSYILKGKSIRARQHLEDVTGEDEVCISAITEAEIRYGLAKRPMRIEVREEVERFLKTIEIEVWDSEAAFQYGKLRASLEAKGKMLANMDMLIAAHAAAIGAVLVTNDKAFEHAEGMFATVNWADDL